MNYNNSIELHQVIEASDMQELLRPIATNAEWEDALLSDKFNDVAKKLLNDFIDQQGDNIVDDVSEKVRELLMAATKTRLLIYCLEKGISRKESA